MPVGGTGGWRCVVGGRSGVTPWSSCFSRKGSGFGRLVWLRSVQRRRDGPPATTSRPLLGTAPSRGGLVAAEQDQRREGSQRPRGRRHRQPRSPTATGRVAFGGPVGSRVRPGPGTTRPRPSPRCRRSRVRRRTSPRCQRPSLGGSARKSGSVAWGTWRHHTPSTTTVATSTFRSSVTLRGPKLGPRRGGSRLAL
jgi:hypothetical protein